MMDSTSVILRMRSEWMHMLQRTLLLIGQSMETLSLETFSLCRWQRICSDISKIDGI